MPRKVFVSDSLIWGIALEGIHYACSLKTVEKPFTLHSLSFSHHEFTLGRNQAIPSNMQLHGQQLLNIVCINSWIFMYTAWSTPSCKLRALLLPIQAADQEQVPDMSSCCMARTAGWAELTVTNIRALLTSCNTTLLDPCRTVIHNCIGYEDFMVADVFACFRDPSSVSLLLADHFPWTFPWTSVDVFRRFMLRIIRTCIAVWKNTLIWGKVYDLLSFSPS